jgi:hypothetical protein
VRPRLHREEARWPKGLLPAVTASSWQLPRGLLLESFQSVNASGNHRVADLTNIVRSPLGLDRAFCLALGGFSMLFKTRSSRESWSESGESCHARAVGGRRRREPAGLLRADYLGSAEWPRLRAADKPTGALDARTCESARL